MYAGKQGAVSLKWAGAILVSFRARPGIRREAFLGGSKRYLLPDLKTRPDKGLRLPWHSYLADGAFTIETCPVFSPSRSFFASWNSGKSFRYVSRRGTARSVIRYHGFLRPIKS